MSIKREGKPTSKCIQQWVDIFPVVTLTQWASQMYERFTPLGIMIFSYFHMIASSAMWKYMSIVKLLFLHMFQNMHVLFSVVQLLEIVPPLDPQIDSSLWRETCASRQHDNMSFINDSIIILVKIHVTIY